ncbi:Uncharacterised protein [Mycobacterium tuberculosis]|nr:Uncharacterised protein [Mycobacterium tuberculosis]
MPGRFREGTETCIRKVRTLETLPTCRQTQNPERGRKLEIQHHIRSCGMLPKSSDPKPREGTETRKRSTSLTILFSRRQTQNPERGRKLEIQHHIRSCGMLPKSSDPKPREGTETRGTVPPGPAPSGSSDPKPREGTETPRGWRMRCARKCRQTQNPERGRKLDAESHRVREVQQSSDPKPREGTETSTPSVPHTGPVPCRQTQNPERGRKHDGTELSGFYQVVVRPKTPRGDGNTPPMTAMSE